MISADTRVLALSARYGRIAYVYIRDGQPRDWRLSCKGARSTAAASALIEKWTVCFDPDVVVIEDPVTATRKGCTTRTLLLAMLRAVESTPALIAKTERIQNYRNMYDEAEALAQIFPELKCKLPRKRRFYDSEPRNIVYFEAISLAQTSGFLPKEQFKLF